MYDFLEGIVAEVQPGRVTLDVQGVGYLILVSGSTAARFMPGTSKARIWTHLVVSDDDLRLFGFADRTERELFRLLISVNGVGPSTGLALLTGMAPAEVARALASGDEATLRSVKGIGAKTATRLVLELKESAAKLGITDRTTPAARDAVDALVGLGFARLEADRAVAAARGKLGETADTEALVRAALASDRRR